MKLDQKEAAVQTLGPPWASMARTFRVARDAHLKLLAADDSVKGPIRRSRKRAINRDYKRDLALIKKLARRNSLKKQ